MDANRIVKTTLSPLNIPVEFLTYDGNASTYITFNYEDDRAISYADDTPQIDIAYIQVHLFIPSNVNYIALKKEIRSKLFKAGFTYPRVTSLYESDSKTNHIIFQCSIEGNSESEE